MTNDLIKLEDNPKKEVLELLIEKLHSHMVSALAKKPEVNSEYFKGYTAAMWAFEGLINREIADTEPID